MPRSTCSIGGKSRTSRRRRLRKADAERFWIIRIICPIESDGNSSVNSNFGRVETSNQVGKRDQSEGVDDQRCSVGANLLVRWRPIGPLPWHRDGTEIGMAKAQRLDTRDTSALQDDKPLTTQRMKWVDDLSQSQRLVGKECSSTSVSLGLPTAW